MWYETFRNRILLPFFNRRGEVIGYTGRDIKGTSFVMPGERDAIILTDGHVWLLKSKDCFTALVE